MTRDRAALLDRVKKLLALAGSPNVHEAAAAAARAWALIEEHRLQELLAAEAEAADPLDPIGDGREAPLEQARRLRKWKVHLATALAERFGCIAYTAPLAEGQAILLAGRRGDREAVTQVWAWLVQRIEWCSATEGPGRDRDWHEAFRVGAAETVVARLAAASVELRASLETQALVRLEPALAARAEAVDRFAQERLHLKPGRGLRVDARAYARGRAAGERLDLEGTVRAPGRRDPR